MATVIHSSKFIAACIALSYGSTLAVLAQAVTGTYPATPLVSKHFAYPTGIPYQADSDTGLIRGSQFGYNQCNSTTENQDSYCQTSFLNSLDDFCLWAPFNNTALSTIADTEGEEVAWCTKPGRGTRLIPEGALQGVQFMRTTAYVQVVGFIDQEKINMFSNDSGGELDPHGADLRGNPLGGLVYSTAFGSDNTSYTQVIEWHNFMGGNQFCFKVCDPAGADAANYCQHIYDRIGCSYNAPNNAQNGTFESCAGDTQDFPGIYTQNGAVMTYTQPPENQGPIQTLPYQPRVPSSSNCQSFDSSSLFAAIATAAAPNSAVAGATSTTQTSASASGPLRTGGTATATVTGSASDAEATSNVATRLAISGVSFMSISLALYLLL